MDATEAAATPAASDLNFKSDFQEAAGDEPLQDCRILSKLLRIVLGF